MGIFEITIVAQLTARVRKSPALLASQLGTSILLRSQGHLRQSADSSACSVFEPMKSARLGGPFSADFNYQKKPKQWISRYPFMEVLHEQVLLGGRHHAGRIGCRDGLGRLWTGAWLSVNRMSRKRLRIRRHTLRDHLRQLMCSRYMPEHNDRRANCLANRLRTTAIH